MVGPEKGVLRTKPETDLNHIQDAKLLYLKCGDVDMSKKHTARTEI